MPKFLLSIEAINIYKFVLDSQDLSTIRGGGILLLEAPESGSQAAGVTLNKITSGASRAVYSFQAETSEIVVQNLRNHFANHAKYSHATISVECVEASGGFLEGLERLTAITRRNQMRSPSFSLNCLAGNNGVCNTDLTRAAAVPNGMSASVSARRSHGLVQKQHFLTSAANIPANSVQFSHDLNGIADWSAAGYLKGKIAVFAVDGNSFAGYLRQAALHAMQTGGDPELIFSNFDRSLATFRTSFFESLIVESADQSTWGEGAVRRIELLMSGGDEMKIVVPAWKGLWLVQSFLKHAATLAPRTFACALIFAHVKAPIHGLTALCEDLLQESKQNRDHAQLSYVVLESFDHVGEDLALFRKQQFHSTASLAIAADRLETIQTAVRFLKANEFPKRKIYEVLTGLRTSSVIADALILKVVASLTSVTRAHYATLVESCGHPHAAWYHLGQLWDYV